MSFWLLKTEPSCWSWKDQIKKGEEQYKIEFSECVLNEFKIIELITDVTGQQYAKYEAVFYAIINYDTIQKTVIKKPTNSDHNANIVDTEITSKENIEPISIALEKLESIRESVIDGTYVSQFKKRAKLMIQSQAVLVRASKMQLYRNRANMKKSSSYYS